MGLLDDIRAEKRKTGVLCRVSSVLQQMDKKDAADLQAAIDDPMITAAAIERVLRRKEITMPQGTITRHRRGECSCE